MLWIAQILRIQKMIPLKSLFLGIFVECKMCKGQPKEYIYIYIHICRWLMKTLFICISLFLVSIITAALPPGYEEELYCPADKCLADKPRRPGWSGPRAAFHRCCNKVDPDSPPLSWGVKKGNDLKEKWLAEGCHQDVCIPGACDPLPLPSLSIPQPVQPVHAITRGHLSQDIEWNWDEYYTTQGGLFAAIGASSNLRIVH